MWGDPGSDRRELGRLHLDKPVNIAPSPCRLYDVREDPCELNDLSQRAQDGKLLGEMKEKLLVRLNENTQVRPLKSRGRYNPRGSRTG